MQDSAKV